MERTSRSLDRRTLLRGLGACLLSVGVAGCSGPGGEEGDDEQGEDGEEGDDEQGKDGEEGDGEEDEESVSRPTGS